MAQHIGCDYKVINRIVNEKATVTPEIATRLALAFETSPESWLNAQLAQDLWALREKKHKIRPIMHRPQHNFSEEGALPWEKATRTF